MMLEMAAAKRWGVPATEVQAVKHEVVHRLQAASSAMATRGGRRRRAAHRRMKLKDPANFRYIGKGKISIVDLLDITMAGRTMAPTHACPACSMP